MQIELQWFHVILTTYGAWLPGDPRGFRTRKHRQHVDGDYKCPPAAGQHERLHATAMRSLTQEVVTISRADRVIVACALNKRLRDKGAAIAIIAVTGRHAHLLAKLPPKLTRRWIGQAKLHATFELKTQGRRGRLWGARGKFVPIDSRQHQVRVYRYIERHESEGAFIIRYKDA